MKHESTTISELVAGLASADSSARERAAAELYRQGGELGRTAIEPWVRDADVARLLGTERQENFTTFARLSATVGIAVHPANFALIRAQNGAPRLANVPPGHDALEFELKFEEGIHLDILTTTAPGGHRAIARYLEKFGEGIQQIEYPTSDVTRAAELIRERFAQQPVYPETQPGADNTRVNFFLVKTPDGRKILIELVEAC